MPLHRLPLIMAFMCKKIPFSYTKSIHMKRVIAKENKRHFEVKAASHNTENAFRMTDT